MNPHISAIWRSVGAKVVMVEDIPAVICPATSVRNAQRQQKERALHLRISCVTLRMKFATALGMAFLQTQCRALRMPQPQHVRHDVVKLLRKQASVTPTIVCWMSAFVMTLIRHLSVGTNHHH